GITVPIQKLAEGTREVAQGNWQYRIGLGDATQIAPDDEFGTLVTAFNQMTIDLETSHVELEKRRGTMETILAELTAGVVALGSDGRVTTLNQAAERLLGIDRTNVIGRDYLAVFARSDLGPAREVLAELRAGVSLAAAGGRVERQMKLLAGGRMVTL